MRLLPSVESFLLGICILCLLAFSSSSFAGTKWALSIGIDDYKSQKIRDLKGCVNDVLLMKSLLIEHFEFPEENVKILIGSEATHEGIIAAIREHLIRNVTADDIVVLHFSGHGSQVKDEVNGDEIDGWDETLVPFDSRENGIFDITDDQINGLLSELTAKTDHVIFFLDSCHSGSGIRGGAMVREIERDNRTPPAALDYALSIKGAETDGMRLKGSKYVLISGCLPHEMSNESEYGGRRHGALSWYLYNSLMAAGNGSTYRSVFEDTAVAVTSDFSSQHPQIEGPGQNVELFGLKEFSPRFFARITKTNGDHVILSAGKTQLVGKGAILGVYPPGTTDFDTETIARLEVTSARYFESDAKVVSGGNLHVGSKALLIEPRYSIDPIPFYVDPIVTKRLPVFLSSLGKMPIFKILGEDEKDSARLLLSQVDDRLVIRGGDLRDKFPPIPIDTKELSQRVEDQVKQIGHWLSVKELVNRSRGAAKVGFSLRRVGEPENTPTPHDVSAEEHLVLRVSNGNSYPLFVYILDISSDGSIALLYSSDGEPIPPQISRDLAEIKTFVPSKFYAVSDTFKVIATSEQIDPSVFPQGAIRDVAYQPPQLTCGETDDEKGLIKRNLLTPHCNPLQDFLSLVVHGQRGAVVVPPKSWATAEHTLRIRDSQITHLGFALHLDKPVQKAMIENTSRKICSEGTSNNCMAISSIDKKGTEWELINKKATRGEKEYIKSIGAVFDEAYELLEKVPGTFRVEPLFEVPMEQPEIFNESLDDRGEKSSEDEMPEPFARKDDQWSLKMIRAEEAWGLLRREKGAKAGAEAQGIMIAHIDTGYRRHPEVWTEHFKDRPVRPDLGHDYYSDADDPWDPLLNSHPLDNPGHATASGSVIVSPPGCQIKDPDGCVSGVAPGAQLIPLRVHRTVAQINTHNMTKAIRDVADGKIDGKPQLISIAMGGPPSISLKKAVDRAAENGILIIAAAGNNVKTIVWPARFKNTVAVAGVNVLCKPWSGSSAGNRIDISAPGQDVWRASMFKADGSELASGINTTTTLQEPTYDIWMGNGTTYATGHTAGAAALWFAYHKDEPVFKQITDNGMIVSVFKKALASSAWQPTDSNPPDTHCDSTDWTPELYGEGILDAVSLLEAPIESTLELTITTRRGSILLPLFGSIYPEGTDANRIDSDYFGIFGKTAPQTRKRGGIDRFETELMLHYTLDKDVRRTIDSLTWQHKDLDPYISIKEALQKINLSSKFRKALDG